MRATWLVAALAWGVALVACRAPQRTRDPRFDLVVTDGGTSATSLAAGDFLEVRVYQEPDLSGMYRVSPEGFVDFPLCGRVSLLGVTPNVAGERFTECLRNGFLRRPQVTVLVKEFNSKKVFVFGDVPKPGPFSYEEGMTIVQALSQAGGFNRTAAKNGVNVVRVLDGHEIKVPVKVEDIITGRERNFALQPGDIVFVPEGFF
ncbi:MAG: polysaccharide biosynthesis/export family protein [Archangium sp.]|nr:polysaccharide biosynthesis/export family protein [Archangium sp.]